MTQALSQATHFSLDVQSAMADGKDIQAAFRESIASYPGWALEGDNTLVFSDGSKATLTDEGLCVE